MTDLERGVDHAAQSTADQNLSIEELGRLIAAKRGGRGVRAAAMDVGVSPATLSRVENGYMPDLETFAKICRWLGRDPREFLGLDTEQNSTPNRLKIEVEWDEEDKIFIALCWLESDCLCAGAGPTVRAAVNHLLDEMRAEP